MTGGIGLAYLSVLVAQADCRARLVSVNSQRELFIAYQAAVGVAGRGRVESATGAVPAAYMYCVRTGSFNILLNSSIP